jgi:hypothetical protein
LHDDRAIELEIGRQQCGSRHHFTEQRLNRTRVIAARQDLLPGIG